MIIFQSTKMLKRRLQNYVSASLCLCALMSYAFCLHPYVVDRSAVLCPINSTLHTKAYNSCSVLEVAQVAFCSTR